MASKRFVDQNVNTPDPYANQYFFYNYDMRGSTTAIIQPDGTLIKGYSYDEFGALEQSGATDFLNEVTFTGSVTDTSSGLQYMNARFYSPSTGRFLSQDTYTGNASQPWTQHLYSYCGNNPVNMIDPTGHVAVREGPGDQVRKSITSYNYSNERTNDLDVKNGGVRNAIYGEKNPLSSPVKSNAYLTWTMLNKIGYSNNTLSDKFVNELNRTIDKYIVSGSTDSEICRERISIFIAQISVESQFAKRTVEYNYGNDDYFFDTYTNQEKFGDIVDEKTGLRRYCGSGYIQLTTKGNYEKFSISQNDPKILSEGIYYVAENYAWDSAGWWWQANGMNDFIDNGATLYEVCLKVNGGTNGLAERTRVYNLVKGAME